MPARRGNSNGKGMVDARGHDSRPRSTGWPPQNMEGREDRNRGLSGLGRSVSVCLPDGFGKKPPPLSDPYQGRHGHKARRRDTQLQETVYHGPWCRQRGSPRGQAQRVRPRLDLELSLFAPCMKWHSRNSEWEKSIETWSS